ncbi:MAG: TlpA family protein disulfide reductase, partial [Aquabacterium sp.]|nr:TlpA family protein disulfide reductase [Ferruginibacter sp.]
IIRKISIVQLFGLLSCNGVDKSESVTAIEKDRPFDIIRLKELNEQPVNLEKYKGKTVFINFWATWCKPCIEEMPMIEKGQTILNKEDIVFLMASSEAAEERDAFKKAHNFNFNYLQVQNSEELNIQGLPTTFIFNKDGKQVFSESGYRK